MKLPLLGSSPRLSLARALAVAVSALLLVLAPSAQAGTVLIKDGASLFTPADTAELRSEGASLPFDVRIVTSSDHADSASFDAYVREQVAEPNQVLLGVDPAHRHTVAFVGTGSGIDPARASEIRNAASPSFRQGQFREGISAMMTTARSLVGTAPSAGAHAAATPAHAEPKPTSYGGFLFGLLGIAAVVVVGMFVLGALGRRSPPVGGGYGGPPIAGGGYPPPGGGYGGYGGPGYGPGYGAPGGGSGLGAGLVGAGVGGLVGYELGKMAGEHEHPQHGSTADMYPTQQDAPGDYVAGGGGSSWDDGSGGGGGGDWGSGGGDAGGGGGDWGSGGGDAGGGGGDWGGGGGDSGGGGSDW